MSTKSNNEILDEELDLNLVIDKRGDTSAESESVAKVSLESEAKDFITENYDPEGVDEILNELKQEPLTNILDTIKFKNKQEQMIFERLPLSKLQKEEFLINTICNDEIKTHYYKIKELKTRCDLHNKEKENDKRSEIDVGYKDEWEKRLSPVDPNDL
jgi:hypothetical protein